MKIRNSTEAMEGAGIPSSSNGPVDHAMQQHRARVNMLLGYIEQFFDVVCPNTTGAEIHVFISEGVSEERSHEALWAFASGLCVRYDIPSVNAQAVTFKVFRTDQAGPLEIKLTDGDFMSALNHTMWMSCKFSVGGDPEPFTLRATLGNCSILKKMLVHLANQDKKS